MAEHSVKLPEPRSDDSEDVVWGLSTASALWARGERRDAVVWIRRAAAAAEAAGNPFRASELGMYLPDLEKALQAPAAMPPDEPPPVSDAAPISSFEVVVDGDTPSPAVVIPPLAIPSLGPVTPSPMSAPVAVAGIATTPPAVAGSTSSVAEAAPTPPTTPPATTPLATTPPVPAATTPPTMPPAGAAPAPATPVAGAQAVTNQAPVSGRQTPIPSIPMASTRQAQTTAPVATNLRPQAVPRRTASQAGIPAVTVPQRPPSDAPAVRTAPPVDDPPSVDDDRAALPTPAPLPQTAPVASATTAAALPPLSAPTAAAQPPAVAAAVQKRKQILRTPILDPWSEASTQDVAQLERRRRRGADVGAVGAARPRTRMLLDEEDEDIITSAAPLEETLGKKHQGGVIIGGTGLAASPPLGAGARANAPLAPPPLPPRAPAAVATSAGTRPPPLPPAVAALTPAPPVVAATAPALTNVALQQPTAVAPAAAPAAQTSAKNPTPAPPAPAGPPSAKTPTPAPPPPAASTPLKASTLPPPAASTAVKASTTPPPPPPAAPVSTGALMPVPDHEVDEGGWDDGSEAPRVRTAVKPLPAASEPAGKPSPVASAPVGSPVPSQRAKLATDGPDQAPPSDIVPTAPRPLPRRSPTIPPAPKLPTGALGKPVAPRPNVPASAADEEEALRKFTDTLPSGITLAALKQAEAEAAAARPKPGIPPPPAGMKPLFEITKKPVPAPAVPRVPAPAPRPATLVPKAPVPSSSLAKQPPPPSVGSPPAPSAKSKSSLPPPPQTTIRESATPPADPIRISNVELRGVEPFSQLPEEVQRSLVRTAVIEDLVPGEARTSFGAVLVIAGEASICAVNLDVPVKVATARSFVASQGSLSEPVPMRIVGSLSGATVSRWSTEAFEQALSAFPRAMEDCRAASDALQARIGLTLGALADVDLATREEMLARLAVRVVEPYELITEEDGPMPNLVFVVGGSVEVLEGDPAVVMTEVRPGNLLFPEALWAGVAAPLQSRAPASGALLLVGDRKLALDFAENIPIVGELLSR